MAIKTHKVTLSLDNPCVIQSGINVQSFDKQSIQISIELTKNDEVFQVPSDATIRVSLLKLARQEQKIIVDVPNNNRDSIDWIVPDYLDGYQGTVRVGVYLVSGTENVDLGYFTILSNVSDINKMADEFTDSVMQGWDQIEADLAEIRAAITQTKLDLAADMTQVDNTIANINTKNTQVDTLHSDFTADVATKQSDVTSKYNAFDSSVTQAGQTIDGILGLADDVQQIGVELNEKANKIQEYWITPTLLNGWITGGNVFFAPIQYKKDEFGFVHLRGGIHNGVDRHICTLPIGYRPKGAVPIIAKKQWAHTAFDWLALQENGTLSVSNTSMPTDTRIYFYAIFLAEN